MQMKMDGRTALVTGGSMGLGRAMGAAFAGAGAQVALVARREEPLKQAADEIASSTGGRRRGRQHRGRLSGHRRCGHQCSGPG